MAQIYPQWITEEERQANPGRRAEYLVYDQLAQQLGDKWLVLYGTAIKWIHPYGVSDRENEFIVAHPELGALAIEVKGGSITHADNRWYTTPLSDLSKPEGDRRCFEIKDPYKQVTDTAKAFGRKINDYVITRKLKYVSFEIVTAVCFPDVEIKESEYLGPDALRELTIDRNDLLNLRDYLYNILKLYAKKGDFFPPGDYGLDTLKNVLARNWHIDSLLSYQLQRADEERKRLTEEQFHLLYDLQENPKMLIAGCAGSGKTMIAAKKAEMLANQGLSVLMICFNKNLAQWLNDSFKDHPSVTVSHFHGSSSNYQNNEYDAIVVDEGQDLGNDLEVLPALLRDPDDGIFYVFFDDNQKIYSRGEIPFNWPVYRLTRNMRNSNQIFEVLRQYYHSPESIRSSGIPGPTPWFIEGFDDEEDAILHALKQLEQNGVKPADITILTPRAWGKSRWGYQSDFIGKYRLTWDIQAPISNLITCSTIHSFKGLESSVVVLTELKYVYKEAMILLLYIAISRAKDYLVVLGKLPKLL